MQLVPVEVVALAIELGQRAERLAISDGIAEQRIATSQQFLAIVPQRGLAGKVTCDRPLKMVRQAFASADMPKRIERRRAILDDDRTTMAKVLPPAQQGMAHRPQFRAPLRPPLEHRYQVIDPCL